MTTQMLDPVQLPKSLQSGDSDSDKDHENLYMKDEQLARELTKMAHAEDQFNETEKRLWQGVFQNPQDKTRRPPFEVQSIPLFDDQSSSITSPKIEVIELTDDLKKPSFKKKRSIFATNDRKPPQ